MGSVIASPSEPSPPPPGNPGERRRRGWLGGPSPILLRILAVNVLALGLLAAGLLYLDRYQQSLVDAELEALESRAELVAAALGESAIDFGDFAAPELSPDIARPLLRRLTVGGRDRARLFAANGTLLGDSMFMMSPGGQIQVMPLPTTDAPDTVTRLAFRAYEWLFGDLPRPRRTQGSGRRDYPEVERALHGEHAAELYVGSDRIMILSVAVPIQRYRRVLGALQMSRDSREIDAQIRRFRLDILMMLGGVALVSALLSAYLASTIARPLHRLAVAADRVRQGRMRGGKRVELPDFSRRHDEIGDLSASLRAMTDALWSRVDAIERFAADVAHEIKNPLSSIRSAVETAARVRDPDKQARLFAIILDDVRRLDRLITDIAGASRLDAELSRAEPGPVDLRQVLGALVEVHGATMPEQAHAPRLCLLEPTPNPAQPLMVNGIEDRLVQVFRNLIANAVSFSAADGEIRLIAERRGRMIRIAVEDDGPGFPPDKADALFDRFYSARPDSERFGTHSGLGLSISRQIVEAHGGRIHAENRIDAQGQRCGARFIVDLPGLEQIASHRDRFNA